MNLLPIPWVDPVDISNAIVWLASDAVLYEAGTDWQVEEIELDPPRAGEVLVRGRPASRGAADLRDRPGPVQAGVRASVWRDARGAPDVAAAFDLVREVTWGRMCDVVVLTMGTGDSSLMHSVLALAAKRGRVVVTNIYPMSDTRPTLSLSGLAQWEKQIVGCIFGSVNSRADAAQPVQGRPARPRHHGHQDVFPGGHQPRLPGHAQRTEHPRGPGHVGTRPPAVQLGRVG
jgi:Zn-dependent alcohol dehydrogenase